MKNTSALKLVFPFLCIILLTACSIDYSISHAENSGSPEFVFTDAQFTRMENARTTLQLSASELEQYETEDAMYGSGLIFSAYDRNGQPSVTGSCGLFAADSKNEIYTFLDSVNLHSLENDITIQAADLKWNNKTGQLISSQSAPVSIIREGDATVTMSGEQFSASSFSSSFAFQGPVAGTITTTDKPETSAE